MALWKRWLINLTFAFCLLMFADPLWLRALVGALLVWSAVGFAVHVEREVMSRARP